MSEHGPHPGGHGEYKSHPTETALDLFFREWKTNLDKLVKGRGALEQLDSTTLGNVQGTEEKGI